MGVWIQCGLRNALNRLQPSRMLMSWPACKGCPWAREDPGDQRCPTVTVLVTPRLLLGYLQSTQPCKPVLLPCLILGANIRAFRATVALQQLSSILQSSSLGQQVTWWHLPPGCQILPVQNNGTENNGKRIAHINTSSIVPDSLRLH